MNLAQEDKSEITEEKLLYLRTAPLDEENRGG